MVSLCDGTTDGRSGKELEYLTISSFPGVSGFIGFEVSLFGFSFSLHRNTRKIT